MRRLLLATTLAALTASAVAAQSGIAIERSVYLEQSQTVDGRQVRALQPATSLRKGDRVVLMLHWRAPGRGDDFVVSSQVPRDLAFRRSGGQDAKVSIDGGRTWGTLDRLRVGNRRATPEDVTHLRWHVSDAEAALGRGSVSFAAVVR
ncbi:hypothetical protein ACFCW2_13315 [Qipengyuania sp. DSG2-2]|uniref:hypothetical protein n=1 Tax=Qipengyuania sp. DGS2-2 TaxID=3349631 RepID=UPI0036D32136